MQFWVTALSLLAGTEALSPKHRRATERFAQLPAVDYEVHLSEEAVSPKTLVVSLFEPEMQIWHKYVNFSMNHTIPGLSPLFPHLYCTHNHDICNVVTGEGEINAAATITALLASPMFNFSETYFLVAGIAGINPHEGSLGSAAFAQYTVSVALQYEVDARQKPKNWSTGYWTYGTTEPGKPPTNWYGTEAFEVNVKLRDRAAELASRANLSDAKAANKTRSLYNLTSARTGPKVMKCDSATSDVYYTGTLLDDSFAYTMKNFTNGSAEYCTTAQEDAAVMEAALRAAKFGLTDYSRWVLLRTASDYDRPPAKLANDTVGFFNYNNTGGFEIAIENLYKAGYPFIQDVVKNWNTTYRNGTYIANATLTPKAKNGTYAPQNYVGDVFGTLGGDPNFGPGSYKKVAYIPH